MKLVSIIKKTSKTTKVPSVRKLLLPLKPKKKVLNLKIKTKKSWTRPRSKISKTSASEIKDFSKNLSLTAALQNTSYIFPLKVAPLGLLVTESNLVSLANTFVLNIEKELYGIHLRKERQNHFFLNELLRSTFQTNMLLVRLENNVYSDKQSLLADELKSTLLVNFKAVLFYAKFHRISLKNTLSSLNYSYLNNFNSLLVSRIFNNLLEQNNTKSFAILKDTKNNVLALTLGNYFKWGKGNLNKGSTLNKNLRNIGLKQQRTSSYLSRRGSDMFTFKRSALFVRSRVVSLKNYVWKRGVKASITKLLGQSVLPLSKNNRYHFAKKHTAFQLSYLISRIEDKMVYYKEHSSEKEFESLSKLRILLLNLSAEKKSRIKKHSFILSTKEEVVRVKRRLWLEVIITQIKELCLSIKNPGLEQFIFNTLSKLSIIKTNLKSNLLRQKELPAFNESKGKKTMGLDLKEGQLTTTLSRSLYYNKRLKPGSMSILDRLFRRNRNSKLTRKRGKAPFWFKTLKPVRKPKKVFQPILLRKSLLKAKSKKLNLRRNWVESKVVLAGRVLPFKEKKLLLSSWLGAPVDIFFINALSFTKFAFKVERLASPKNNPNNFLSVLDRDFINKYKYIGIYIKDLVRIAWISMLFKKPSFIAKFVAFQLAKLPRNRKETSFIRFLIKVIRTLGAERKEIKGVRIKFKGRVNRWRRTKFILGNRGSFPLQTISERIEQGSAQAINRKGAVGVRIWVRYKNSFGILFQNHMFNYINYSKLIKARQLKKRVSIR